MEKLTNLMLGVKTLDKTDSAINGKLTVVKDLAWGVHIKAGGLTQSGGVVTDVWKTSLKKVKSLEIKPKNCLILGLGGGSIAEIVHKFWPKVKITGVDLDPQMVEFGKKYMNLEKLPVEIVIAEAFEYCKKAIKEKKKFDMVLVDVYQGSTFPEHLQSEDFVKAVQNLLTPHGVVVFNMLFYDKKRLIAYKFLRILEKIFPTVTPVYPEANVMFICRL